MIHLVLIFISVIALLPFLWMLSASFKHEWEVFAFPIQWIPENPYVGNYVSIWQKIPFLKFYINSIKLSVLVVGGQLFTCSLAAYSFTFLRYRGRNRIFLLYLATMMIPFQVVMIPQFMIVGKLGMIDTHWALIVLEIFSPYGVFLLKQFYQSIPMELVLAARIDGCREFRIYSSIILPLAKPALATLGILTFTWSWNSFLVPLIYLTSRELWTIPLGLTMFTGQYFQDTAMIMTATTLALVPSLIIFIMAQKYFVQGITTSGIKG